MSVRTPCTVAFLALAAAIIALPSLGTCAAANDVVGSQSPAIRDLRVRQDTFEHKLQVDGEVGKERVESLRAQLNAVDSRIADTNSRISDVIFGLTAFGVLVTIVGFGVAVLAIVTAGQRARETAEQWLSSHTQDLQAKIDTLSALEATAKGAMDAAVRDTELKRKEAQDAIKAAIDRVQASLIPGAVATPSQSDREVLKDAEQILKGRPETEYSAEDWADRAFAAYADLKLALAAEYFDQASQARDASPREIARYMLNRAVVLDQLDRHEDELAAYDALIARFKDATEPDLRERVAHALFNRGVTLGQVQRPEEALAAYDDLITRFKDSSEPALREQVAKALLNRGVALTQLQRPEEELAAYDDLIERFKDSSESALRERVAKALFNKALTLGQLKRPEEALSAYDDLITRFEDASEPDLRELVAKSLLNRGGVLTQLQRSEEALAAYDDLIRRFEDAGELALRQQVAMALLNQGVERGRLQRPQEALAAYDDLIARFKDSNEPALREQVAKALFNKGETLGQLERREEALTAYDELIARFKDASEPAVQELIEKARAFRSEV